MGRVSVGRVRLGLLAGDSGLLKGGREEGEGTLRTACCGTGEEAHAARVTWWMFWMPR